MSSWPERVEIREVGPRDGLQNEAPVPVERSGPADRRAVGAPGCAASRRPSFVSPTAIPPMAGADEVMAADHPPARASSTRRWCPTPKGAERAIAAEADEIELVVSASETHNQKNVRRSVAESLVGAHDVVELAHGAGIAGRGDRVDRVRLPVRRRRRARAGRAGRRPPRSTRAPTGSRSATPPAWRRRGASTTCSTRSSGPGSRPIGVGLHFHDTRGTALANVVAALERGVTRFDASIGGLGGCPYAPGASGNAVTEDLVHMLDDMGIDTGIDLDALIDCARARAGDRRPRAAERAAARRRRARGRYAS